MFGAVPWRRHDSTSAKLLRLVFGCSVTQFNKVSTPRLKSEASSEVAVQKLQLVHDSQTLLKVLCEHSDSSAKDRRLKRVS